MIYAVDFDGTIYIQGKPNLKLISYLILKRKQGNVLILNTCRTGKRLKEAVDFCNSNGLYFHMINENFPQVIKDFGTNPRKIYADVYIDDKSINPRSFF